MGLSAFLALFISVAFAQAPTPLESFSFLAPMELVRICACESAGSPDATPIQFNANGSVVHGRVHKPDTGACQINASVHAKEAKALGMDLNTLEGNLQFALQLYSKEGNKPWSQSKSCWGGKSP